MDDFPQFGRRPGPSCDRCGYEILSPGLCVSCLDELYGMPNATPAPEATGEHCCICYQSKPNMLESLGKRKVCQECDQKARG